MTFVGKKVRKFSYKMYEKSLGEKMVQKVLKNVRKISYKMNGKSLADIMVHRSSAVDAANPSHLPLQALFCPVRSTKIILPKQSSPLKPYLPP
jgi:hypothetical protein